MNLYKLRELEDRAAMGENVSEQEIVAAGGCPYCGMMGYEDYPSNTRPCRIHPALGERVERFSAALFEASRRPWTPQDGKCCYCGKEPCEHWSGTGWWNPRFYKKVGGQLVKVDEVKE